MTKNELMEMAREVGLLFNEEAGTEAAHAIHHKRLQSFFNAILERAAVELEGAWHTAEAAESIRALKINTGD